MEVENEKDNQGSCYELLFAVNRQPGLLRVFPQ